MSFIAAAVVGSAAIGGVTSYVSGQAQAKGAKRAAATQVKGQQQAADEARAAYGDIADLLQPYADVGGPALQGMMASSGLLGPQAQQSYISGVEGGAEFQGLVRQGEEAILQNASATGGLRGGNVQGALAQFRPGVLSALLQQQYGRLAGLENIGSTANINLANARGQLGANVANSLTGAAAASAKGMVGAAAANAQAYQGIGSAIQRGIGGLSGQYQNELPSPAPPQDSPAVVQQNRSNGFYYPPNF